ncbi:hypothetical protein WALSEDRAFT_65943 [Wallemia mellicola CBS 633.66]|uniref:Uncharacterized protein n=1 Tax=Wallemia mellicola (strain ATCC MYA-4683 / CBS 633.66) TaxID=671144 RepID=I4Y7K0_WALMC|nr:hypothetical protein WALSEDRAFT_65943 [Wallemia mellicola CBS 633.66]EIM19942.1 hypothetical protein WALSEDRAFT_65943 [Wallemia mellicola CBS 633.66]|eukprot:XP_006960080.1 hypothetical protein WALSEDRAFT_65943 [Wallemia mellicola CBS 633.66]
MRTTAFIPKDMCFQVECNNCGKQTWSGCGLHKNAVMDNIPKEDRCGCPR